MNTKTLLGLVVLLVVGLAAWRLLDRDRRPRARCRTHDGVPDAKLVFRVVVRVHAEGYRARLEDGMFARDGGALGLPGTPVTVTLRRGDQIVQLTLERRLLRS